ncbi:MAG: hypothetical protein ABMA64_26250 [Myxococcota bacterium]
MDGFDPTRLAAADPAARADAIRALRYRDLKDGATLRLALRAARDLTPVSAAGAPDDPFANFFGADVGTTRTLADLAAERLQKTGLPPDAWDAAAEVLEEPGPPGRLPAVLAAALAETRWTDPAAAVRALAPGLSAHDVPLFTAILALPSDLAPVWVELALSPLRPRLFQELLNHPPSRDAAVAEAERVSVAPDRAQGEVATVCTVLTAWGEPAAGRIALAHEARWPWLVAARAVDDPSARPALAEWLAGDPQAPPGWWARVAELLGARDPLPEDGPTGFSYAGWLRAAGDDHGLFGRWGVTSAEVAAVAVDWVRAGGPRATVAGFALIAAGRHGPVASELDLSEVAWEADALDRLAAADPPLPGLLAALLDHLRADPSAVAPAASAVARLGGAREAAEIVLAAAEAAPERVVSAGRGLEKVVRAGVDVEGAEPWIDPASSARFEAVRPVVRAVVGDPVGRSEPPGPRVR